MPESVTDRPTRSHEYIFLLTKSPRYYYDAEAIKEHCIYEVNGTGTAARRARAEGKRDVWWISPASYPEAHFATFSEDLIKPCILAGCPAGGMVLDPFGVSGTTGKVALELGRKAILIKLNENYLPLIKQRVNTTPGLAIA